MMAKKSEYMPYLDGLRGVAISIVILSHIGLDGISPGALGVNLFFFLSGFLITKLLLNEFEQTGTINFKFFYIRRIIRLYPALIAMICLSIVILVIVKEKVLTGAIFSSFFYAANYYLLYFKPPGGASDYSSSNIFDIIWSLSVEEHFYLVFPFIFYIFRRYTSYLVYFLCLISIAILCYRVYLIHVSTSTDFTINKIYLSTQSRADSIIWGCIPAILLYQNRNQAFIKMAKSTWPIIAGILLILVSLLFRNFVFRETARFTVQAIAFILIIPSLVYYGENSPMKRALQNKALVWVGKLSYSLYLFHWPVIILISHYFELFSFHWEVLVLVLSFLLATASYYFIEQPLLAIRKKLGSNVK
ncbi:acyltransferase family protein [Mucilaginibacter sp. HD30]